MLVLLSTPTKGSTLPAKMSAVSRRGTLRALWVEWSARARLRMRFSCADVPLVAGRTQPLRGTLKGPEKGFLINLASRADRHACQNETTALLPYVSPPRARAWYLYVVFVASKRKRAPILPRAYCMRRDEIFWLPFYGVTHLNPLPAQTKVTSCRHHGFSTNEKFLFRMS